MTTKYTLQNAAAFVAITGNKRGLTINTRCALIEYTEFKTDHSGYDLTEAGQELAERSRLWKAHKCLLDLGYYVDHGYSRKHRVGFIRYKRDDDNRTAFTGGHGRAYADRSHGWQVDMVGEFKNG